MFRRRRNRNEALLDLLKQYGDAATPVYALKLTSRMPDHLFERALMHLARRGDIDIRALHDDNGAWLHDDDAAPVDFAMPTERTLDEWKLLKSGVLQ